MTNDTTQAEVAALQKAVDCGDLVESHGRLVHRNEIARAARIDGGIVWPAMGSAR